MKIPDYGKPDEYFGWRGGKQWRCTRLFHLAKDLPVMDVPLDHLNVYFTWKELTLREMVMHMKAVQDADMSCPIILDEDGDVLDGRHRIMKAILTGAKTIKAVRFDENPPPDKESD
jgi:hypothetical protein